MNIDVFYDVRPDVKPLNKSVRKGQKYQRLMSQFWLVAIAFFIILSAITVTLMPLDDTAIDTFRHPVIFAISGLSLLYFAFIKFLLPKKNNQTSIPIKILTLSLTLILMIGAYIYTTSDGIRNFGQAGLALQQCFGPAAAAFKSSSFPQVTCLQTWGTPYSIIERRKMAELNSKGCLRADDEKIANDLDRVLSQFDAFDPKDKILSAFHANNIPLSTADGRSYFAKIATHCLDSAGFDKNSQFKVVVIANFGDGDLLKDVVVSSSNASYFNSMFAKNGIAESYRVNFEIRRSIASIQNDIANLFSGKGSSSSNEKNAIELLNISLVCTDESDACNAATLIGTVSNKSSETIRLVSIRWGIYHDNMCDMTIPRTTTIAFDNEKLLAKNERRDFNIPVDVPPNYTPETSRICSNIVEIR